MRALVSPHAAIRTDAARYLVVSETAFGLVLLRPDKIVSCRRCCQQLSPTPIRQWGRSEEIN